MKLKQCPCCSNPQTTKTALFLGRNLFGLFFTCKTCLSTFVVKNKNFKEDMNKEYPKKTA
jgi:transposase-like protein